MRRPLKKKHIIQPDLRYNSTKIEKFINYIMEDGKKNIARTIVYDALDVIKEKTKTDAPLEVFEKAIKNAGPTTEVRPRRVGGANYMVPREVKTDRKETLAFRWIIEAAKNGKGRPMHQRIADELISASNNEGAAITKKLNTHKMAEANKAFAHFAW